MPVLSLHLLRLGPFITVPDFVVQLQENKTVDVVIASRPRYKLIKPATLDVDALKQHYDVLLLVKRAAPFWPSEIQGSIVRDYRLDVGIPTQLFDSYPARNAKLINDAADVKLTGALDKLLERRKAGGQGQGQKLELDEGLLTFMEKLSKTYGDKPVTMLNLLRFNEGKREDYLKYGKAFAPVAAKRGGNAKLVGRVVPLPKGSEGTSWMQSGDADGSWDEISLVHYPSMRAMCDMLAGEDYQSINSQYRLGALKDTFLMCTTEIGLDTERRQAKL